MAFIGKYVYNKNIKANLQDFFGVKKSKGPCFYIQINQCSPFCYRKTVVHGGAVIPHPFGISLFEHSVYFTDWTKMAVMTANKFSDSSTQVVFNTSQTPHGVAVIHQLKQPYGKCLNKIAWYFSEYRCSKLNVNIWKLQINQVCLYASSCNVY